MIKNICPKLPLELDENNKYVMINNIVQNVKQKLKTILFTAPGERFYDHKFGIGIKRMLFETIKDNKVYVYDNANNRTSVIDLENDLNEKLKEQFDVYIPEITRFEIRLQKLNNIEDAYNLQIGFIVNNFSRANYSVDIIG